MAAAPVPSIADRLVAKQAKRRGVVVDQLVYELIESGLTAGGARGKPRRYFERGLKVASIVRGS
jgi:hypothetical protein